MEASIAQILFLVWFIDVDRFAHSALSSMTVCFSQGPQGSSSQLGYSVSLSGMRVIFLGIHRQNLALW